MIGLSKNVVRIFSQKYCARCHCFSIKRWSFFLVSFSFSRALDYFFSMFSAEYARDVTVLVLKSGLLSFFLSLSISRFRALFTTSSRCYCCSLLLFVLLLIIIDADGCRRLMPLFNAGLVAIVAATASSSEAESAL